MEQISIFEVIGNEVVPFEHGDQVRVKVPNLNKNAEDYFYLTGFYGKRGCVKKIVEKPSLQYHVDFDGKEAIVYHKELKHW